MFWSSLPAAGNESYNRTMARGWESKAVEAQQYEAASELKGPAKHRLSRTEAERLRQEENLRLSLRNVKQQVERARDVRHRSALERALAELEERLRQIEAKSDQAARALSDRKLP